MMMTKIFCSFLYLLVVFGDDVFGSENANSLNFDISNPFDEKEGSISALTTSCSDTGSCNSETITDDAVLCHGYSSCTSSTITVSILAMVGGMWGARYATITASSGTGGGAYCSGRWACRDAIVTTNGGSIQCVGSVSCYSGTYTNSGEIDCKGDYACAWSDISASTTICQGSESCIRANIVSSSELRVEGIDSASNAYISGTPTIYDSGENTFNGATISSNGTSTLYITSYGYKSTSEATVLCYDGATCNLDCLGDESCTDTTFYCENGATCETYCDSCANCISIDYVDSIADELGSSLLLLKSDKQDEQDFKPVIMENNVVRSTSGISNNNNKNLLTDGTLILFKILCFAVVYETIKKFVFHWCVSRSKKHKYQKIDDGSLRYTRDEMAVVL